MALHSSITYRTTVALALLIGCAVASAAPPVAPLTSEDAIRTALATHPGVRALDAEMAGAREDARAASALPSPELTVAPAGVVDDARLSLRQPLALNGERRAARDAARARRESHAARREARRREIAYAARVAFTNALAAREEREVVAQAVALLEQIHQAAVRSFEAGNAPESHVVRTRIEVTRVRQELCLAEAEARAALAALNTALGRDAGEPVTVRGELPKPDAGNDYGALRADAHRRRPEVAAAEAEVSARQAESRLARAGIRPDLVLEAKREGFLRGGGSVGVGVTLPFLDWGRRRAEVRRSEAAVEAERARLAQQRNAVSLDVQDAIIRVESAAQVVDSYEKEILADAERLAQMTRVGYQEGALSYLEVLDAQRALAEARRGHVRARAAYAAARAALDLAVGAPIEEWGVR